MEKHFDDNGFSRTELLPGVYDGGIRSYKCFLKAGCKISPELYKDKGVVILFGQGKGAAERQGRGSMPVTSWLLCPDLIRIHMKSGQKRRWSLSLM